jgi:ferredoxin
MDERTEAIRQTAKKMLADQTVDCVLGYRAGTVPMTSAPFFAHTPDECDQLIWDANCRNNLANFLPRRTDKVAVVAKGCETRNILGLIVEKQIDRNQVHIIGVPCRGMVDPEKIQAVESRPIQKMEEEGDQIVLTGKDFTTKVDRRDVLRQNCAVCVHRNPPVYDELIGEPVEEQEDHRYDDLEELLRKSPEERWAYYQKLIEPCIRCYGCRDACPLCYCPVCFVDESIPQWVGKSQDPTDVMTYHLLRAFHCAGRCTDCGACESACPMGIKVRQFTRLLEKDIYERFGYEAGMSLDQQPPLTVYQPDDPQEFIK